MSSNILIDQINANRAAQANGAASPSIENQSGNPLIDRINYNRANPKEDAKIAASSNYNKGRRESEEEVSSRAYQAAQEQGYDIDTWYSKAEDESNAASERYNQLKAQLDDLSAKRTSQDNGSLFGSVMAKARGEDTVSDDELSNLQKAVEQAKADSDKKSEEFRYAKQYKDYRDTTRPVEEAYERGISYDDINKAYSQSLDKLNKDRAAILEELNTIRHGGKIGDEYYMPESPEKQKADEDDALARLEKVERQLERIEGLQLYAQSRITSDRGAEAVIRQGEELARTAREQGAEISDANRKAKNIADYLPNAAAGYTNFRNWVGLLSYLPEGGGKLATVAKAIGEAVRDLPEAYNPISFIAELGIRKGEDVQHQPQDNWTKEQIDLYNYFYGNKDYGPEIAKKYAQQLNYAINTGDVNNQTAAQYQAGLDANGGFLSKAGKTVGGLLGAVPDMALAAGDFQNKALDILATGDYAGHRDATSHEKFSAFNRGRVEDLNRNTLSENIPVIGGKGWGDLYQLGQSSLQSLAMGNILGEAATLGAFFVNAANSSFDEAMQRTGGNTQYASTVALLSGAAEVIGEKLSLDHLLKGGKVGSLPYILKQAGIEGSEEVATSLMNQFFDRVASTITGEQTAIQQQITNLVRSGTSYADAEKQVWRNVVSDVAFDFVGGALSGGFSGGVQSVRNSLYDYATNRNSRNQQNTQTEQPTQPTQTEASQRPTTRNPLYEALNPQTPAAEAATVAENATTEEPAPATPATAQAVETPAGEVTTPTAETTTQPQTAEMAQEQMRQAETAQERLDRAQARYAELERAFDNGEVSEEDAPRLAAEMEQRYNEIQELTPLADRERQSAADVQTQQARVQNGEVSKGYGTPENHIDRRTPESVGNTGVKSFQFDNPQLHGYYVEAAQALFDEVQRAEDAALGRAMSRERGSAITGPIRRLMDMGLTKPQIVKCLQDIIADNGQENYAAAKRVELVLNDMLTNGWQGQYGRNDWHEANADYIAAKDAIDGGIKADSWEKYLADHELSLITGEVTEEELRAEWEQMHPQKESATVAEPETVPETSQPVDTPSAGTEQSAGTIPASEQTTAERTNGTGNERERNMSRNLRGNEKAEPDLRNSFEQNRDLYTQLTNAEVAAKAAEIVGKGYDAAKNDIYEKIGQAKAGAKLAPEYAVAGYQLANEMVRRGETEAARELCADIAAELTFAGQVGQIGRLILASDPSIRIRTVERLVKKLNDGLSNRQKAKNIKNNVGTETGGINVSDEALQRYAEAETDEDANAAMDAIEQEIADQIPATFRDKFTALRYLNMLGNLKTQGRNIVGNAAMMTATNVKYLTQHVMELARAAATGGKYEVNTALNTSKELRQQAAADFEANKDEIEGDAKYSDVGRQAAKSIQKKRQIFGTTGNALWDNTVGRGLEGARKATNWAMEVGDEIFLRQVYVRSFAGWMKAHGVTDVNSASPEQVSAAREFAKKEAQEATFHDSNKVSDWVSSLGRGQNTPKVIKMISEGIVPFRKTPANVAVRAIEYSPAGAIGTIYEAIQAKKGNASAADVINSAAKNLTGTALFGIGMLMAAAGRARASGDDEDEKLNNFKKLQGEMDYSVKVGDKYVSLSQLAPMAIPFFMGVKLNELMEYNDNLLSLDSLGDILGVVSEPMLEMSMLSGVNDFLNDLSSVSGDTDALPSLIGNAALSYLSQGLTNSLLGQLEQASERNRQTTYSDTKSADATGFDRFLGKNQYKIGKYSAKVPGIDYNQQDYVDAWGRTQSNGGVGERAFNAFLNPTYTGKDRSTDVDEELERLYRDNKGKDDFPDVFPQKRSRSDVIGDGVVMTPDEYLAFSQESGQKKLELVREFMQSADYKNLTDEQRAETIHNLYAFADATALQKVRDANGVEKQSDYAKLITGVKRAGDDIPALDEKNVGEYIAYDAALKTAVDNGDYASIDNLLMRYSKLNQNTQDVLAMKNPAGMNNLLKYVNAGSSAESYFKLKEAIGDVQDMEDTSSENARIKFNALVNADIPDKEKAELVESGAFDVAKSVRTSVGAFSKAGYSIEDAYNFYMKADSTNGKSDGEVSQGELVTALEKDTGMSQQQKNAIYEYYMQQNGWKTGYDAALKNATKSGKKYGVA